MTTTHAASMYKDLDTDIKKKPKNSFRTEIHEERKIGKMSSLQIAIYLAQRNQTALWAGLFFLSNTIWLVTRFK